MLVRRESAELRRERGGPRAVPQPAGQSYKSEGLRGRPRPLGVSESIQGLTERPTHSKNADPVADTSATMSAAVFEKIAETLPVGRAQSESDSFQVGRAGSERIYCCQRSIRVAYQGRQPRVARRRRGLNKQAHLQSNEGKQNEISIRKLPQNTGPPLQS